MPPNLEALPEPAELHARLNNHRAVDWGDPMPSKKEIAAEFGIQAAERGLAMIARAAAVEPELTQDLLASVQPGTVTYQLKNRLKSPQSLARKIRKLQGTQFAQQPLEDILRYTIVAAEPDDLVKTAVDACEHLHSKGWAMDSAHHSYVDGSRYKGLHLFLRSRGELIELQIHSRESIAVKTRSTPHYEIERDPRQDRVSRNAARAVCIAMSDQMKRPADIDELTMLGGVAVTIRSYGMRRRQPVPQLKDGEAARPQTPTPPQRSNGISKDGISR
jgi:hypothetical protein